MKISYVIGTHNEEKSYLVALFDQLLKYKDTEDEIIVVDDFSTNPETVSTLDSYKDRIGVNQHALNGNFAEHKNYMNSLATGDFIFNIDADENVNEVLLQCLKEILINNPSIEAYRVPRLNIVPDITEADMKRYGWSFYPGTNFINLPDAQTRIYKNSPDIKWKNKVHEVLTGYATHTDLPYLDAAGKVDPSYCLLHIKTRQRQIQQNTFYETI